MEEKYEFMWNEYICGRCGVAEWLKFCDEYYDWYRKN